MANTGNEILLTLGARNAASSVFSQVDNDAKSMASSISSSLSSINSAFMNFGQVSDNLMQSLTGKSALDNILGTASKNETNMVLLNNMLDDSGKNFDSFYETVDKTTDSSLVSMQELIPALNAFKSATGATDDEIKNITPSMANFGAAVLAQTGSVDLAQQAMMDLSKGYKGAFASLDQYGVSKDALMRTGYWSGEEEDVEGYMKAVTEVIGSTDALMETNQGLDALIGKSFSRAGKKIGNDFLPIIKDMKRGFIDLDNKMGGAIASTILIGSASIESGNRIMWNISTAAQGFRDLKEAAVLVKDAIKGIGDAAEETGDTLNTISNVSDIGAGAAGVGEAATLADDAGDVGKKASKTEKVVEGGTDALFAADTLSNLKSGNKYDLDAIKEATRSVQSKERLTNELDNALEAEGKVHDLLNKQSKVQSNIDSGVFGKEMVSKFKNQVKQYDKEIDDIIGSDFWTAPKIKPKSKPKNYFKELLSDDSLKDGKKSLADIMASRKDNFSAFDDFVKANKNARDKAGDTLKSLSSHEFIDDDILKEWEKSEWGVTDAIKYKFGNFKTKITNALTGIKDFDFKKTLKTPFKKLKKGLTSFKEFNFGSALQSGFEKGFSGLGGIAKTIKTKFSSFGSSLAGLKNIDISSKLKGLDQKLFRKLDNFSFKDSFSSLKKAFSGLKGSKVVEEGIEEIAETGSTMAAAGPKIAASGAGAEAVSAGATGLSATFTSMIVPLLAISAVIIIMIPIVAVIAAEALIFIRLLADFMEALNFDNVNLDGAIKGISQVAIALAWVGVAMAAMTFTSIMTGLAVITSGFLGIAGPLDIALNALNDAASKLQQFSGVVISPSIATNLQTISSSLLAVSTAMAAMTWNNIVTGFSNWIAGALGFSSVTEGLDQAKNDIISASQKLQEFSSMPVLDESVANNIQNVCNSLASVGDAMSALRSIRDSQNWDAIIGDLLSGLFGEGLNIQEALDAVKKDIQDAATALQNWKLPEVAEGNLEGDKIKKISDTLSSMAEAFKTLRGFRDDNIWDDMLSGLFPGANISDALDTIKKDLYYAANSLKGLGGLPTLEEGIITKIKNIINVLTELTNVATSLTNIPPMEDFNPDTVSSAVKNVQSASDSLKDLDVGEINEDTITNIKNVAGALAGISGVMTTLTNIPPMDGFDPSTITTAVSNVQTIATELNKLSENAVGEDVNDLLGSINTALQSLKDTLSNASGFSESSVNIGTQIVSGVQSGLSPLPSTVTTAVSSATSGAASTGWTGGAYIGQSITGGFQSALKLADVMTTEMSYVKTAVDNGISAAKSAAESGAREVVDAFKSGINVGSPGDISRTMEQEMAYTKDFIVGSYGYLKKSAYNAASAIVEAFGSPKLNINYSNAEFNRKNLSTLETMGDNIPFNSSGDKTIIFNNNITVDARNKTEKEARGILTLALESMDHVTNVDIDGA